HRHLANDNEQPARALLRADARGAEAPGRRAGEMGPVDESRRESAALRLGGMMGWVRRLRTTFSRSEGDFDEERRFHIDERTDEYVRNGMSREEARRAALKRFGN